MCQRPFADDTSRPYVLYDTTTGRCTKKHDLIILFYYSIMIEYYLIYFHSSSFRVIDSIFNLYHPALLWLLSRHDGGAVFIAIRRLSAKYWEIILKAKHILFYFYLNCTTALVRRKTTNLLNNYK